MSVKKAFAGPERRQFGRRETSLHAWIKVPGRPALPCIVKNLSVGGALLQCERPRTLPYTFELIIDAANIQLVCETRHTTDTTIGVMFNHTDAVQPAKTNGPPRPAADEIEKWLGSSHRRSL